jgi:hypothetical protein
MHPTCSIVIAWLRQTVTGVAILAVLMMTIHVHAAQGHACSHDSYDHGGHATTSEADLPALPDPVDPDGCTQCHCPSAVVMPDGVGLVLHPRGAALAHPTQPDRLPESRSDPPDPPPAKLS